MLVNGNYTSKELKEMAEQAEKQEKCSHEDVRGEGNMFGTTYYCSSCNKNLGHDM